MCFLSDDMVDIFAAWTAGGKGKGTLFTVEQLEKMMEDPTVQKMVYP